MTSFEDQIGKLRSHISDLEARLSELRSSRDRISSSLNEFLNLQGFTEMLRATSDPRRVAEALLPLVRRILDYDAIGVYLFNEAGNGIEPLNPAPAILNQAAQSQYEEGIFDWVVTERRPVVIPWLESFGGTAEAPERNLVIAPLAVGDRPMGTVILSTARRPDDFSPQELRMLSFVVTHAAVAIQNALRSREAVEMRDFFQALLEHAGDVIFALDLQGRFTYLNPRLEELGWRREDLLGQSYQTLFRTAEVGERILGTLMRGARQTFDLELKTRLARTQQYTISLVCLKNDKGERSGAMGMMRNVTEIHRQHKKLLESERLAAYAQTVITLNHEINNPLTAVMGNLYLLEKEARRPDDEKLLARLKVIQDNCQRIQNVIKKMERIDELKTVPYLGSTHMVDLGGSDDD
jgi:PAS domain S-box-containing protein